jgi:hypothetical protein
MRRVRATMVAVEKQKVFCILCVCVCVCVCVYVALVIQHAMRMRHMIICGLPGSRVYFHIISYMARLKQRVIEHKWRVMILYTIWCATFLITIRTERDII